MQEINDYCRCDVLDTYFVFLRTAVLMGDITLEREIELTEQTQNWLADRAEEFPVYREYLDQCCDWVNPWAEAEESESDTKGDANANAEQEEAKDEKSAETPPAGSS